MDPNSIDLYLKRQGELDLEPWILSDPSWARGPWDPEAEALQGIVPHPRYRFRGEHTPPRGRHRDPQPETLPRGIRIYDALYPRSDGEGRLTLPFYESPCQNGGPGCEDITPKMQPNLHGKQKTLYPPLDQPICQNGGPGCEDITPKMQPNLHGKQKTLYPPLDQPICQNGGPGCEDITPKMQPNLHGKQKTLYPPLDQPICQNGGLGCEDITPKMQSSLHGEENTQTSVNDPPKPADPPKADDATPEGGDTPEAGDNTPKDGDSNEPHLVSEQVEKELNLGVIHAKEGFTKHIDGSSEYSVEAGVDLGVYKRQMRVIETRMPDGSKQCGTK